MLTFYAFETFYEVKSMTPCKAGHDKLFKNFFFKFTLNYDNDYNKRSI